MNKPNQVITDIQPVAPDPQPLIDLKDPSLILNRELSWLEFNRRVLEEAQDPHTPIMEKLKFISIVSSNLDEFVMIRVGSLVRLVRAEIETPDPSGKTPMTQLNDIALKMAALIEEQYECFRMAIIPDLKKIQIEILKVRQLPEPEETRLRAYFMDQVFPVLTPLAVDAGHPFPYLGNLRLNIMVIFDDFLIDKPLHSYAFVEVPAVLPRLIPVKADQEHCFILLEDLIIRHMSKLFPGMKIRHCIPFRVTRNLDYDLHENDVLDLLASVEAELRDRSNQIAVRLEIQKGAPQMIVDCLRRHLDISPNWIFNISGPINLCGFMPIYDLDVDPDYRDPPFNPRIPKRFDTDKDIFTIIREGDILLHHPYDSFAVIVAFLNVAADDPDVLAIKQTLYRTGHHSPIIGALRRAAANGKQVTAIVELKARFDEQSNIDWARRMEEDGINVVYGFVRWKVHCKATLVVRREKDQLRRYVHLSTGNYNSVTARIYTDLGLLTVDPDFGQDVSALFNVITGFNSWTGGDMFKPETVVSMFKKIYLSPVNIQQRIIELIDREIQKSAPDTPGRIIAKMNTLVDPKVIRQLYKASQSGVQIDLIVRGVCCLRPGIPGISENIRVISILDRFLEHTRIYYFHNGGDPDIYSGSADWMPRNFNRRVEALYPIEDKQLKSRIIKEILLTYLKDNVKSRIQRADGMYTRIDREPGRKRIRSQDRLIAIARKGGVKSMPYEELVRQIGKRRKNKLTFTE